MDDARFIAAIVGLIGILRAKYPKVDGLLVPATAVALAVLMAYLKQLSGQGNAYASAAISAMAAVGGMTAVGYGADRVGTAMAPNVTETKDGKTVH